MSFRHACEHCGTRQLLTDSEFDALGGQFKCDDCKGIQQKTTIERKTKQFKASRLDRPDGPKCEKCGAREPRMHVTLDANLREDRMRLCTGCGKKLRYTPVNYERYSMHIHGREQAA